MGWFDVLKKPPKASAPPPKLRESLAELQEALGRAEAAEEAARARFVEKGDDASERAVEEAEATTARLRRHVERVEALIREADAREAAEERRKLEAEAARLREQLDARAIAQVADPLDREELEALLRVVEIRAQRHERAAEFREIAGRLESIELELGLERHYDGIWIDDLGRSHTPMPRPTKTIGPIASPLRVAEMLEARARTNGSRDPIDKVIHRLAEAMRGAR